MSPKGLLVSALLFASFVCLYGYGVAMVARATDWLYVFRAFGLSALVAVALAALMPE